MSRKKITQREVQHKEFFPAQFSILNSQFSMNYQLPITNETTIWQMVNGKYLVNGKWLIVNEAGGDL